MYKRRFRGSWVNKRPRLKCVWVLWQFYKSFASYARNFRGLLRLSPEPRSQDPLHPTPSCHVICHTFHSRQWVSSRRHQVFIRPRMLNFWWDLRPKATLPKKKKNKKFRLLMKILFIRRSFMRRAKFCRTKNALNRKIYLAKCESFDSLLMR